MATNYIQDGDILDYTAGAAISAGDVVVIGTIGGVAITDIANGATGAVAISGVFRVTKATGAVTQGALLYWNATNSNLTTTATGATLVGVAAAAALSGDATVDILLNGVN